MKKLSSILFLCYLSFFPFFAQAADMYIILDKARVNPRGTFTGTIYISTGGLPINNAEATLHFPTDLVSVDAVSTGGSIFNIWVEQPTFSNSAGTVMFNGGLPTPGYAGQSGQALRVIFRAKSNPGTATISLGAPAIRANDGSGTNVLSQARGATITIAEATPTPTAPTTEVEPAPQPAQQLIGTPHAPVITSTDMPDANSWYSLTKGTFAWGLPSDVSVVQLVLSSSPRTTPTISYDPPIKNKVLEDLTDGVLYLNGRFKNTVGWSRPTSRKIQIDTTEPEDLVAKTGATDDDLISITATADDATSGISKFTVLLNGTEVATTPAKNKSGTLTLPPLTTGKHMVTVRAYDLAGNFASSDITIDAPEQKVPKITHYPEFIKIGSKIEVRGKAAYTTGDVTIWIQEQDGEAKSFTVKPDEDKVFAYTSDTIKTAGEVSIWAVTARTGIVKSASSDKVYVSVKESDVMWLGIRAVQVASLAVSTAALFFLFIIILLLGTRKVRALKRLMRKELGRTEQDIHKVFAMLQEDTKRRIHILEKASTERKLTKEEEKLLAELTDDLTDAEKFLTKQIQDIEDRDL